MLLVLLSLEFVITNGQPSVIGDFFHKRQLKQEEELNTITPLSEIAKDDS